jgi:hypothetical protein
MHGRRFPISSRVFDLVLAASVEVISQSWVAEPNDKVFDLHVCQEIR